LEQFYKLAKNLALVAFLILLLFSVVSCEDSFTPINPISLVPLLEVSIEGGPFVREELVAITNPVDAIVSYQWFIGTDEWGEYEEIPGATTNKYKVLENQEGSFFRVRAIGKEEFIGSLVSSPIGPIEQPNYYKLRIFLQSIDGESYDKHSEHYNEKIDAKIGSEIVATYEDIRGFIPNRDHPDRIESGVVTWLNRLLIILYYDREVYTVTFNSNGGTEVSPIEGVMYENGISKPADDPKKLGYDFVKWYSDAEFKKEWVFENSKVIEDTTLYVCP
jgi:hypothetical protein